MSVPLSEFVTPLPSSPASECVFPGPRGERSNTSLQVRGPNLDDWKESLALCILCGINYPVRLTAQLLEYSNSNVEYMVPDIFAANQNPP